MKTADARVLLTGAAGGIGRAMLLRLADAGARVTGVGRGEPPPGLPLAGWVRADLGAADGIEAVAQAARRADVNLVIHAAGRPGFGALDALAPADIAQAVQLNLIAPMLLTRALLPALRRQPHAQIVFVGSALGRIGLPGFSVYGASKAGLHGFAEALRRELADSQVRVQMLAPRGTRTGFNDAAVERYNAETGAAMDPPEVVAAALLRLIESEAAERYIGFPERFAVRLNAGLGAWLDGAFARHRRSLAATRPAFTGEPAP
jgi:short-subunit dehydrogenase